VGTFRCSVPTNQLPRSPDFTIRYWHYTICLHHEGLNCDNSHTWILCNHFEHHRWILAHRQAHASDDELCAKRPMDLLCCVFALPCSLVALLVGWLVVGWLLVGCIVGGLVALLVGCIGWLVGWLVALLVGCIVGWLVRLSSVLAAGVRLWRGMTL